MNNGKIYVYFSENIYFGFKISGLAIQTAQAISKSSSSYTLTTGNPLVRMGRSNASYSCVLTPKDLNLIKYGRVATSSSTSFLTAPFGLTYSISVATVIPNLKTTPIKSNLARRVRFYFPDVTPPLCLTYNLNLNARTLTLVFNEPVLPSSLQVQRLTLMSTKIGSSTRLTNSSQNIVQLNISSLEINISRSDLNSIEVAIKESLLDGLMIGNIAVADYAGNFIVGNDETTLIPLSKFQMDTLPANILWSSLNFGTGIITLFYNKIVNVAGLLPSQIFIMNGRNFSTASKVQLSDYSVVSSGKDAAVLINMKLYNVDLDSLEQLPEIAVGLSNCYFAVNGLTDIFGNVKPGIDIFQCTQVIGDTTLPTVQSFDAYDVSSSRTGVSVFFSKVMKVSSFSCADFKFRSEPDRRPKYNATLTKGQCTVLTTQKISRVISFTFEKSLWTGTLGGENSTFMNVPALGNATDIFGNRLAIIYPSQSLAMGPQVTKYILNMNTGTIQLVFSSPIMREGYFNPLRIGFFSEISGQRMVISSNTTKLLPYLPSSPANDSFAVIQLSTKDLNDLKIINVEANSIALTVGPHVLKDPLQVWLGQIYVHQQFHPT